MKEDKSKLLSKISDRLIKLCDRDLALWLLLAGDEQTELDAKLFFKEKFWWNILAVEDLEMPQFQSEYF